MCVYIYTHIMPTHMYIYIYILIYTYTYECVQKHCRPRQTQNSQFSETLMRKQCSAFSFSTGEPAHPNDHPTSFDVAKVGMLNVKK